MKKKIFWLHTFMKPIWWPMIGITVVTLMAWGNYNFEVGRSWFNGAENLTVIALLMTFLEVVILIIGGALLSFMLYCLAEYSADVSKKVEAEYKPKPDHTGERDVLLRVVISDEVLPQIQALPNAVHAVSRL